MRTLALFVFTGLFLISCTHQKDEFVVSGKFKNTKGEKVYLYKLTSNESICIDSAVFSKDGAFELKGMTQQPVFLRLELSPQETITLLAQSNDNIELSGDASNFSHVFYIKGSYESILLKELLTNLYEYEDKGSKVFSCYMDSIALVPDAEKPRILHVRDSIIHTIVKEQADFVKAFIRKNPSSFASLMSLYYYIGNKRKLIDPETDFTYYQKVDSAMITLYPNCEPVIKLNQHVTELGKMVSMPHIGKKAPEIVLPDTSGKNISLTSLRGKYVLLCFWGSWCDPCRVFNKQLGAIYKKYNEKSFGIYQVAIDKSKTSWKKAIREDGLVWENVSDLQLWDSPIVAKYSFEELPVNFLLDPNGTIMETNLSIEHLDEILSEIFK